jgi:hypothetical protein
MTSIGDATEYPAINTAETSIILFEGKSIEFDIVAGDLLVGGMMYVKNTGRAKGIIRVILKPGPDDNPICEAIIDLEKTSSLKFERKEFRFIQGLPAGTATIRLEILDDIEPEDCNGFEPVRGREVEILAVGSANHRAADYELPNTDDCMKEQEILFEKAPSIPIFGKRTNRFTTMPRGIEVCCKGVNHLVYPVRDGDNVYLYRHQLPSAHSENCNDVQDNCAKPRVPVGQPVRIDAPVDGRACAVRFEIANGKLYYLDGFSEFQSISICDWTHSIECPTDDDVDNSLAEQDVADGNAATIEDSQFYVDPDTLKIPAGGSLIRRIGQRFYISGFRNDPNLVKVTLIDGEGAKYNQSNEAFYSPDRSPADSACTPVTALAQLENDLVVFRTDGNSVYRSNGGLTFGTPQLLDTFSWNVGVQSQEDVAEGNGNIYIYNRSEGFRRFAGTDTSFQSQQIDNELRKIDTDDRRFAIAHANKVRLYFDREDRGYADHCALYHTILAGSSPWFMDNQTPVQWAVGDQDTDRIYAMHSQYPATYIVDHSEGTDDQLTDFDCIIPFEYSTNYKSPGTIAGHSILKRVIEDFNICTTQPYMRLRWKPKLISTPEIISKNLKPFSH